MDKILEAIELHIRFTGFQNFTVTRHGDDLIRVTSPEPKEKMNWLGKSVWQHEENGKNYDFAVGVIKHADNGGSVLVIWKKE